ncbi:MAG TPA: hypothetical protein VK623_02690 [Flavobacterium sp.]|nr:hypothetical protein [Flavobacterium sp.]
MHPFINRYKYHLLLVFIGLAWIHIFDFLTQMSSQGIIYPDSRSYCEAARNLYVFHRGHNYRPMLLALINGIPYAFGGSDASVYGFSYFVNLFCWLAFPLVLFEIVKQFLKPEAAFFISAVSLFFIGNTVFVFHLFSENIYMFFIISGFYFLSEYFKKKKFRDLSAALAIFILAILIKPGSMFLAIIFGLFFIKDIIRHYRTKSAWFIYGSVMLIFIQCAGVKYQFGNFTVSYIDATTFYGYLGERATALDEGASYKPRKTIYSFPCPVQKEMAAADMKRQLLSNTKNLFKAYGLDLIENATTGSICLKDCKNIRDRESFPFWKSFIFKLSEWQNRLFSIIAILLSGWFLFKSYRKDKFFALVAFFIGYNIFLSGISFAEGDRFNVITFPFALILLAKLLKDRTKILA